MLVADLGIKVAIAVMAERKESNGVHMGLLKDVHILDGVEPIEHVLQRLWQVEIEMHFARVSCVVRRLHAVALPIRHRDTDG